MPTGNVSLVSPQLSGSVVFRYPDERHKRRLQPGPFVDYRSYKPYLREEFARRCVYCRFPDHFKYADGFGVDHYRPRKKYQDLAADYGNLFYCCNSCNSKKGDFWPNRLQYDRRWLIPNPCHNRMSVHLWYEGETAVAKTPSGKCAVDVLRLNAPDAVHLRQDYARVVRVVREARNSEERRIEENSRRLRREKSASTRALLEDDLLRREARLVELRALLEDLVPPDVH